LSENGLDTKVAGSTNFSWEQRNTNRKDGFVVVENGRAHTCGPKSAARFGLKPMVARSLGDLESNP
jgi:hypothetical protein